MMTMRIWLILTLEVTMKIDEDEVERVLTMDEEAWEGVGGLGSSSDEDDEDDDDDDDDHDEGGREVDDRDHAS